MNVIRDIIIKSISSEFYSVNLLLLLLYTKLFHSKLKWNKSWHCNKITTVYDKHIDTEHNNNNEIVIRLLPQ